ncbi:MAG TPA: M50 family metallopeptidase [Candidatus Paceibacterota bacterium]|jgi:regulator of sigma E protease|nr:M50 family metallopeptidase [Candidatus Paceibacterota bacterium]
MTIIIFILVLLVCVLAHEWGHFFAARTSGLLVEEFGFGIPPRLWAKKKGETVYSVNALPIGGFVKIAGENGVEEGVPIERQIEYKPWYVQGFVLVAGVVANIILALVLFTIAYSIGMPTTTDGGTPTIVSISPGLPAEKAGIAVGDTVERISAGGISPDTLDTDAIHTLIQNHTGSVVVDYVHDGIKKETTLEPVMHGSDRLIGVAIEPVAVVKMGIGKAIGSAWFQVKNVISAIWYTLGSLLGQLFGGTKTSVAGLVGPVGLAHEIGGAARIGLAYLIAFTAAISVNLAVINILPFPALDGGRLLVVLLEAIFRRKFSKKIVGLIHTAGFVLLLGLMLVLTVGDVRRLL